MRMTTHIPSGLHSHRISTGSLSLNVMTTKPGCRQLLMVSPNRGHYCRRFAVAFPLWYASLSHTRCGNATGSSESDPRFDAALEPSRSNATTGSEIRMMTTMKRVGHGQRNGGKGRRAHSLVEKGLALGLGYRGVHDPRPV
ncbi:hypothetical protein ACJ73_00082 [Blastomyces percursus]|uniref:Uncharacterized protein n=1 Tax=Blastomyces percursus TaxID=1658174 RepID=A0A1J9QI43_9EURO|nr:hypothetical protein ACJ73_00082 [Blastomyces percursus]